MRFLVDAQLPPALARRLIEFGNQAEHVADVSLERARDRTIAEYAITHSAIIVTKDEDFVMQRSLRQPKPTIIWIRIGNATNRELLARVSQAWPTILSGLERGDTIIEMA